jgi:hypothetical protein
MEGLEFLYSKDQKEEIARHAPGAAATIQTAQAMPEPVVEAPAIEQSADLDSDVDLQTDTRSTDSVTDDSAVTDDANSDDSAIEDSAEPVMQDTAEPSMDDDTAEPAVEESAEQAQDTLPETASGLHLLGLLGAASLGLKLALRRG